MTYEAAHLHADDRHSDDRSAFVRSAARCLSETGGAAGMRAVCAQVVVGVAGGQQVGVTRQVAGGQQVAVTPKVAGDQKVAITQQVIGARAAAQRRRRTRS